MAQESKTRESDRQQAEPPVAATASAVAKGDVARLVADFHEVLYRYAYRLSGSTSDAEDLTQQVFLTAQQKLGQLREADCVRSWLFTVLRNCYFKGYRRHTALLASNLDLDIDSIPAKAIDDEIDGELLQQAINELADEFKLVVVLFYFEQRSYREIAELLAIPTGTVMSRLSRAKSHLRKRLFEADNRNAKAETERPRSAIDVLASDALNGGVAPSSGAPEVSVARTKRVGERPPLDTLAGKLTDPPPAVNPIISRT